MKTYTYASDIEATKNGNSITIEPLAVDLEFTIKTNDSGCEYAEFPGLAEFFARDDVSFSAQEQAELENYFDCVARGVE